VKITSVLLTARCELEGSGFSQPDESRHFQAVGDPLIIR
jgi:hypothetical protein